MSNAIVIVHSDYDGVVTEDLLTLVLLAFRMLNFLNTLRQLVFYPFLRFIAHVRPNDILISLALSFHLKSQIFRIVAL